MFIFQNVLDSDEFKTKSNSMKISSTTGIKISYFRVLARVYNGVLLVYMQMTSRVLPTDLFCPTGTTTKLQYTIIRCSYSLFTIRDEEEPDVEVGSSALAPEIRLEELDTSSASVDTSTLSVR